VHNVLERLTSQAQALLYEFRGHLAAAGLLTVSISMYTPRGRLSAHTNLMGQQVAILDE
jgi:hypothetical protein